MFRRAASIFKAWKSETRHKECGIAKDLTNLKSEALWPNRSAKAALIFSGELPRVKAVTENKESPGEEKLASKADKHEKCKMGEPCGNNYK